MKLRKRRCCDARRAKRVRMSICGRARVARCARVMSCGGAPAAVWEQEDELHGAGAVVGVHARHLQASTRARVRMRNACVRETQTRDKSTKKERLRTLRACTPPSSVTGVSMGSTRRSAGGTPSLKLFGGRTRRGAAQRDLLGLRFAACGIYVKQAQQGACARAAHRTRRAVMSLQYTGPACPRKTRHARARARQRNARARTHARVCVSALTPRAARACTAAPASSR